MRIEGNILTLNPRLFLTVINKLPFSKLLSEPVLVHVHKKLAPDGGKTAAAVFNVRRRSICTAPQSRVPMRDRLCHVWMARSS